MTIKFNFRLRPYPFFEIRYVKPNWQGSYPIIGFFLSMTGVGFVVYPFVFSLSIMKSIKPAPMTEEEKKQFEELLKAEEKDENDSTNS